MDIDSGWCLCSGKNIQEEVVFNFRGVFLRMGVV